MRARRGLIGIVAFCLTLELVSRAGFVSPEFLPPFSAVLATSASLLANPTFLLDVFSTLTSWSIALAITCLIAIPLGITFGLSDRVYRFFRAFFELLRPIPAVALIPLALLLIGPGLGSKLLVTCFASLWPILFNTIYGVRGTEPLAKEMATSFGFSRLTVVRRIVIPSAAPFIMTGVRVSSSIALILVITVEMLAGSASGIGSFIAREQMVAIHPESPFAGALIAGLLGLLINTAIGAADRRLFRWQTKNRAVGS